MIEENIINNSRNIYYINNEKGNQEYTREVNECYYIILDALCLSVTSDRIKLTESFNFKDNKIEINLYCNILKEINNIIQELSSDLYIYLNKIFIIDELIKVIDFQKLKTINLEEIEEIRNYLRKSALIIQNNQIDKSNELIVNFEYIYDLLISKEIKNEGNSNYYNKYYDTLRYILFKEIAKTSDTNYHCKIFEKILQEEEIIKKSNDIFEILFKKYISEKDFKNNLSFIIKADDKIINLIENYLSNSKENHFALSETLLYFFEKKSIIYLNNALYNLKEPIFLENEPLDIFKDCSEFLGNLIKNRKNNSIKYIPQLYCLGYIKVFCFTFIKMFDEYEPKFKEPEKIIEVINKNIIKKVIKLYIYKILFNQNKIDVFFKSK